MMMIRQLLMIFPYVIIFTWVYRKIYKSETKKANSIHKYVVWAVTLYLLSFLINQISNNSRSTPSIYHIYQTGPVLALIILSTLLIFKKFKQKTWIPLLAAFTASLFANFEHFVILITSIHRDYITGETDHSFIAHFTISFLLNVVIASVIGFFIFRFTDYHSNKKKYLEVLDTD